MDTARGLDERIDGDDDYATDGAVSDDALNIGTDERRMHVRAYNYWVSLLGDRPYPAIQDLDPASLADFGPNSVLLDFSQGIENPGIRFLGAALRSECGIDQSIAGIADVPPRSLLSRLTDHYLQIIANRAPIGFEAEFVSQRGHNTFYRGILMPFSSSGEEIDFIYGVINWKEMVDAETQAKLNAELDAARRTAPSRTQTAPVWADGPSGGFDAPPVPEPSPERAAPIDASVAANLADSLMMARESAAAVRASDVRSRAALYRALGRAHDFGLAAEADPMGYATLLLDAGLKVQPRAPTTPVVKLVFGLDYDKTRVTEFAAVLAHARRHDIGSGELADFLERQDGGIKAVVKAERDAKRPAKRPDTYETAATRLRGAASMARVAMDAGDAEFVLLVARAGLDGMLDIVARVDDAEKLTEQVVRRVVK